MADSRKRLTLAELESLACALLTVLLALLDASVAGQQAFGLERLPQLRIELDQCTGNAHLHCVCLRGDSTATNSGDHIEARCEFNDQEGHLGGNAQLLGNEVLVECLAVDFPLTGDRTQENAGDRRFAASRSVILNQICHSILFKALSCQLSAFSLFFQIQISLLLP